MKTLTRAACDRRDGYCRSLGLTGDRFAANFYGALCSGPSEWAHFGQSKRARTRGQTPEIRHTTAGSLMLCQSMHRDYDAGRLLITALTKRGCDGPLRFRFAK